MALTYEEFLTVLPDAAARRSVGLAFTDEEASALLANRPQAVVWYQQWTADRQRNLADPYKRPAGSWSGSAIAGFIFSIVGIVCSITPAATFGIVLAGVGVIVSAVVLHRFEPLVRGRGLALAGLIVGICAVLSGLATWLFG